jgi:hypothetical protein
VDGKHGRALRIAKFGIADAPAVSETLDERRPVGGNRFFRCDDAIHRYRLYPLGATSIP